MSYPKQEPMNTKTCLNCGEQFTMFYQIVFHECEERTGGKDDGDNGN